MNGFSKACLVIIILLLVVIALRPIVNPQMGTGYTVVFRGTTLSYSDSPKRGALIQRATIHSDV